MNAPLPKFELVLSRCPNKQAIAASVASVRAWEWLRANQCYSDNPTFLLMCGKVQLPNSFTMLVSPCYDVDEVIRFLGNKEWAHIEPDPCLTAALFKIAMEKGKP